MVKAFSCTSVHLKSFRELNRGLKGARMFTIWLVLDANWSKNNRRSVQLLGVGKFDIAAVMSLLIE